MRTTSLLVQAAVTLTLLYHGSASAIAEEKPTTYTVIIDGMKFTPDTVTVKVGDSVIWVNKDIFPHTATELKKEFNSGEIKSTKSWKLRVKEKGSFSYFCSFHPTMKASLVVK